MNFMSYTMPFILLIRYGNEVICTRKSISGRLIFTKWHESYQWHFCVNHVIIISKAGTTPNYNVNPFP